MAARPGQAQEQDPAELATRVEELEAAIATALKVNKLLHVEVEKYVCTAEQLQAERDAWHDHAKRLAAMHAALRRQVGHGSGEGGLPPPPSSEDGEEGEDVAALLRLQEQRAAAAVEEPCTSGMAVQPTPEQLQAIKSLVARGKAAGWLIKPEEVVLGPELGKGTFGTTYRGVWQGAEVAVKCVRVSSTTELTTFLREVEAMSLVRHPNVVPFLGACLQSDHFWLLAEFMPGGTMASWLKGAPPTSGSVITGGAATQSPRSLAIRARAGLEVAQGMQALHCQSPCIMHRDLKPSNIFMDAGGHARVGDFGLSRRLMPTESRATLTGETGTYLYMAPEVMRHDVYDLRCDVWSWGVMWAELMDEGRTPYWHLYMTPVQVALAVAEERLQPHIPDHLPTDLQVIGRLACQFDPDSRPSFATIISELQPAVAKELEQGGRRATFLDQLQRFTSSWGGIMERAIFAAPNPGLNPGHATPNPGKDPGHGKDPGTADGGRAAQEAGKQWGQGQAQKALHQRQDQQGQQRTMAVGRQ